MRKSHITKKNKNRLSEKNNIFYISTINFMLLPIIITNFTVVLFLFAFLLLDNNIFVFAFGFFFSSLFSSPLRPSTSSLHCYRCVLFSRNLMFHRFNLINRQSETGVCSMDSNLFEMENANSIEWHLTLSIQRGEKRGTTKERTRKIDNMVLKCNGICHARHRTEKAKRKIDLAVLIDSKCSIKRRVNDMDIGCGC